MPMPEKTDREFVGWYTDNPDDSFDEYSPMFYSSTPIESDVTLYACYEQNNSMNNAQTSNGITVVTINLSKRDGLSYVSMIIDLERNLEIESTDLTVEVTFVLADSEVTKTYNVNVGSWDGINGVVGEQEEDDSIIGALEYRIDSVTRNN